MTLVDTSVLLDVLIGNPIWAAWSVRQLEIAAVAGPLLINDLVFAELAVGYADIGELDDAVRIMGLRRDSSAQTSTFSDGEGFPAVSETRRYPHRRVAGFLHRGTRGCYRYSAADAGCKTVSGVFSDGSRYRPGRRMTHI